MAKKSQQAGKHPDHGREVQGVLYVAIASFIFLCLYSYHPLDPSLNSPGSGQDIKNLGGIVGSYLADFLYVILGVGAFFLPGFLVVVALSLFIAKPLARFWLRAAAALVFAVLSAVLCQLVLGEVMIRESPFQAGGVVGWSISHFSVTYLGLIGTYLFVTTGMVLTLLWATQLSVARIVRAVVAGIHWLITQFFAGFKTVVVGIFSFIGRQCSSFKEALAEGWSSFAKWREKREPLVKKSDPEMDGLRALVKRGEKKPTEGRVIQLPKRETKTELKSGAGPTVQERKDKPLARKKGHNQLEMVSFRGAFELPQISYLDSPPQKNPRSIDEKSLRLNARVLDKKLQDFGVEGTVMAIRPGPVITLYEFEPAPGVKVNKIVNLADDLSVAMGGRSVRIVPHLPGKAAIGIELPNSEREMVVLRDIIAHPKFQKTESKLPLALGKDSEGDPMIADLAKMPHLLVAGATGAGKSVSINSMICSFLYKATPNDVRMILVDPKMLELSVYEGIPHLLLPVITEPKKAVQSLRWAVMEMEKRYRLMADAGIRDITAYNKKLERGELSPDKQIPFGRENLQHLERLPFIVIIIDELADIMMTSAKELEDGIVRLAQKARASGIHLILATQRPSVDVITGIIKANFPARISFKVSSRHDSRTILDRIGSERLLGSGDMLFLPPTSSDLKRVHGAFLTEIEIKRIVDHLKKQGKPVYRNEILETPIEEAASFGMEDDDESDELYDKAVGIVSQAGQASISMVQRHLRIGYNRAARLIEKMETEGVVGPADGSKPRQVLVRSHAEGT
jgi:DNA segregation ATPase FtsK/SpoIIIE, S-DNA-T family